MVINVCKSRTQFQHFLQNEDSYQSLINKVIYTHCKKFKEKNKKYKSVCIYTCIIFPNNDNFILKPLKIYGSMLTTKPKVPYKA